MLGFFYGSYRNNEENFEFYKKIRKESYKNLEEENFVLQQREKVMAVEESRGLIDWQRQIVNWKRVVEWLSCDSTTTPQLNKNSSGDEIANVNFYAVLPEGTRIR